jgi:hypothetical protein
VDIKALLEELFNSENNLGGWSRKILGL